jgi:hypothetical protein
VSPGTDLDDAKKRKSLSLPGLELDTLGTVQPAVSRYPSYAYLPFLSRILKGNLVGKPFDRDRCSITLVRRKVKALSSH